MAELLQQVKLCPAKLKNNLKAIHNLSVRTFANLSTVSSQVKEQFESDSQPYISDYFSRNDCVQPS